MARLPTSTTPSTVLETKEDDAEGRGLDLTGKPHPFRPGILLSPSRCPRQASSLQVRQPSNAALSAREARRSSNSTLERTQGRLKVVKIAPSVHRLRGGVKPCIQPRVPRPIKTQTA